MSSAGHRFESLVARALQREGYELQTDVRMYGQKIDFIVAKQDRRIAIEAKDTRSGIMNSLASSIFLKTLPGITSVCVAIPQALAEDDIISFARNLRIGVMVVTDEGKTKWLLEGEKIPKGSVSTGSSVPNNVIPGETFEIKWHLHNQSQKIVSDLEIECIPAKPLQIARGERRKKKIGFMMPGQTESLSFRIAVSKKTKPGEYIVFLKTTQNGELRTDYFPMRVAFLQAEDVRQLTLDAVGQLDSSISNISKVLSKVHDSVVKGVIDIRKEVIDKSIWNEIGSYCLRNGLYEQARVVYEAMLQAIRDYEQQHLREERVHKGLALHNLGIALYYLGRRDEAKARLKEAYEEDKLAIGYEGAEKGLAKKALDTLTF